jgi:hypothetical protein
MSDVTSSHASHDDESTTPRVALQAALERLSTKYADELEQLAECSTGLARLVQARRTRPWTNFEYDAYLRLRLRRRHAELNSRANQLRRGFERATSGLRNLHQTH